MTTQRPTFPHAPITEALLDIRVELPKDIEITDLDAFHDSVRDTYSEKQQRVAFTAGIKVTPNGPSAVPPTAEPNGFIFRSPEGKKLVQARLDGFTFNKLRPYSSWAEFSEEARSLWDKYCNVAKPKKITRIALRYINKIEIPLPFTSFQEYILTLPQLAPTISQTVEQFFMQLVIPYPERATIAVINETIERPTNDRKLPFIYDIDVYKQNLNLTCDTANLWDEFNELRNLKNDIFLDSITEKTKELFK